MEGLECVRVFRRRQDIDKVIHDLNIIKKDFGSIRVVGQIILDLDYDYDSDSIGTLLEAKIILKSKED